MPFVDVNFQLKRAEESRNYSQIRLRYMESAQLYKFIGKQKNAYTGQQLNKFQIRLLNYSMLFPLNRSMPQGRSSRLIPLLVLSLYIILRKVGMSEWNRKFKLTSNLWNCNLVQSVPLVLGWIPTFKNSVSFSTVALSGFLRNWNKRNYLFTLSFRSWHWNHFLDHLIYFLWVP